MNNYIYDINKEPEPSKDGGGVLENLDAEERKNRTTYNYYCDKVLDLIFNLKKVRPKMTNTQAVEIVKAMQLMRIADNLDTIRDTINSGFDVFKH